MEVVWRLLFPTESLFNQDSMISSANYAATANHAATPTGAQITETNCQFDAACNEFQKCIATEGMLKRQILDAMDPIYLDKSNDDSWALPLTDVLPSSSSYASSTAPLLQINSKQTFNNWDDNGGAPPHHPPPRSTLLAAQKVGRYYCWSHGLSANPCHTSTTCL
jgi:hypothetical protein